MLTVVEDLPRWGNVALLVDEEESRRQWAMAMLPRLLSQLTEIQRHVLARLAVHSWTHGGSVPFYGPTPHQRAVAFTLTDPAMGLVVPVVSQQYRLHFRLTQLGEVAARHIFHVLPSSVVERQETTFNRMCVFMRNDWEPGNDDDDDVGARCPAPQRAKRPYSTIVR